MEEPYTVLSYSALSNGTGMVGMLVAWAIVRHRIKRSGRAPTHSVKLMRNFFLLFGTFYVFLTLPFYYLYFMPDQFPMAMAIGFTIGHVFAFAALTYTFRLLFTLMPRLAPKEHYATMIGIAGMAWVFIVALITMVFGTLPVYDYANHLVNYQQEPILANTIAIGAAIVWVPLSILLLVNAVKSHDWQRLRSLLLGLGFLILTFAGPLHGLAQNHHQLLAADLVTIVALLLLTIATVFRIGSNIKRPSPHTL